MAARIEVLALKPLTKGPLRAFVSVRLGGVTIHDFRIVQQEGQAAWVSCPQREYTDQTGKKKYSAVVELTDSLKKEVDQIVLAYWEQTQDPPPAFEEDF